MMIGQYVLIFPASLRVALFFAEEATAAEATAASRGSTISLPPERLPVAGGVTNSRAAVTFSDCVVVRI